MNQILDEIDKNEVPKKIFSKLAFGTAIITTILMFYFASQVPSEMKASDIGKPFISPIFPMIMGLSCLLGLVFSIISFVKKEPSSFMKWVAAIVNIAPLLIVIWVNIYDFLR